MMRLDEKVKQWILISQMCIWFVVSFTKGSCFLFLHEIPMHWHDVNSQLMFAFLFAVTSQFWLRNVFFVQTNLCEEMFFLLQIYSFAHMFLKKEENLHVSCRWYLGHFAVTQYGIVGCVDRG